MMVALDCILCGFHGEAAGVVADRLRDEPDGGRRVVRCPGCGHVQLSPPPSPAEDRAFRAADQQPRRLFRDGDHYAALRAKAADDVRRRLRWLRQALGRDRASVLDVGAAYGFFVDAAAEAGFDATGLEATRERLDLCRAHMRGTFLEGEADEAFAAQYAGRFDAVTCFHALHHRRDPLATLGALRRLVRPGGVILIEVPNLADELIAAIPDYAAHQWQFSHVSYFDAATLAMALRTAGLADFTIHGAQRYGLRHLLRWADRGEPDLAAPGGGGTAALARFEALYRSDRERALTCDTLVAEVRVDAPPVSRAMPGLPEALALVVFDFDGVFTDNKVYTFEDGREAVACSRGDGLGLDGMRAAGVPMMILSTETNPVVAARGRKLKLPVEQSCGDKAKWLAEHLAAKGIDPARVAYLGNDLNDLAAMRLVGYPVAPGDAHPEIKRIAAKVLSANGGNGAVREFCDFVLYSRART